MKSVVLCTTALTLSIGVSVDTHAAAEEARTTTTTSLEEIVVTAQRREETVQKSSLAIEVLSADQLAGVTQPGDLNAVTPGLQIQQGSIIQTFIRGVGSIVANGRAESAIAYSLDGVYLATGSALSPALYDIARVEILKGPQGTLYGRNATGGAVNFITNGPKLGELSGYVGGDVGNFDLRRINGAVNIPGGDTFATRAAFQVTQRDGYYSDGTGDDDTKSVRIRSLWEPNADFSILVNLEGARVRVLGGGSGVLPVIGGDAWRGPLDPQVAPLVATTSRVPPRFNDDLWSASAEVNANVGIGTLTVIPAYRYERYDSSAYTAGFFFGEKQKAKQKTFEARLANQTDTVKWVAGAYYYGLDQAFTFDTDNDLFVPPQNADIVFPDQETTSWAVFGETTISIIDPLRVIVGVRYTKDEQSGSVFNNSGPGGINPLTGLPTTSEFNPAFPPLGEFPSDYFLNVEQESSAVSWKGGLEFDITEDSMAFLTATRGFKGGGFIQEPTGQLDPKNATFDPEEIVAWELGVRNRFLDDSLQVNVGAFHWKYDDQQVAYVGFNSLGAPSFLTQNAGNSKIYGADLDVVWRLTSADTVRLSGQYLHARYEKFQRVTLPGPTIAQNEQCTATPLGLNASNIPQVLLDCSGAVMQRAPTWTGALDYSHRFELPNGAGLTFGADSIYTGRKYLGIDYTALVHVDETVMANADLTYSAPDDRWSITAWAKNLTDEEFYQGGGLSAINPNVAFSPMNPPRTYGVRFNVKL